MALAVARDPQNTLARGLSGLVTDRGQWEWPEAVKSELEKDPAYRALVREYLDRRARTPHKAETQLRLAAWCSQNGLKEQALAHYHAVVRLDPSREIAWRHLGYKKQGNRWLKPEEAAAEKLEAERQKHADLHWKPRLERLLTGLHSPHAAFRAKAEQGLAEITDPRAVPMIGQVLARGPERSQLTAVRLLGQIEGPAASNLLAALAIFSASADVRRQALDTLIRRDPRDVVGRLINLIRRPFRYAVRTGNGPGTTGELWVDGEQYDIRRLYRFPTMDFRLVPVTLPTVAASSSPALAVLDARIAEYQAAQTEMMMVAAMVETLRRNQAMRQSLANDIQAVVAANPQIDQVNGRVLPVLKALTGQELGAEPESWRKWWTDQLGYVYQSSSRTATKPTYTETVTMPDLAMVAPVPVISSSCFAAGTCVQTIDGPRAIESIQVGDRVLSQNTSTASLAFQPVVAVHRNAPAPTLRIAIDGETIVATGIHRFWKAGRGWTMARELKAGDRLRRIGGVVAVQSVESDATQPVYNLDVAENRDFFVGTKGLLVHDFSFVRPVSAPFDRQPDLAGPPRSVLADPRAR